MDEAPQKTTATGSGEMPISSSDLRDTWSLLSFDEKLDGFKLLPPGEAEKFFLGISTRDQAGMILIMPPDEQKIWMRFLAPDDAVDVIQEAPAENRETLLNFLDPKTRTEVSALLAYKEDEAGGLMNPRYARVRPDMAIVEAISYMRKQTWASAETIYYAYVIDSDQRLLGVASFREILSAPVDKKIRDVMHAPVVSVAEGMDQEAVSRLFTQHKYMAIPVVDADNRMKGVVAFNDIVDVVQEEATEDIHKIGGSATLDAPYLQVGLREMIFKRAGWLALLFVGEMLTASAMGFFEHEIASAVILALFIPLIISSGGNAGSQATTLVIRALSLGQLRLRDWWRVFTREALVGLSLGAILAVIGLIRILIWQSAWGTYGEHFMRIGLTVSISVGAVVLWGCLAGAMLPFALRRFGFDPASASAPLVATVVDVTGLVIYFSAAHALLTGTLL